MDRENCHKLRQTNICKFIITKHRCERQYVSMAGIWTGNLYMRL